jgi:hypothetical protein
MGIRGRLHTRRRPRCFSRNLPPQSSQTEPGIAGRMGGATRKRDGLRLLPGRVPCPFSGPAIIDHIEDRPHLAHNSAGCPADGTEPHAKEGRLSIWSITATTSIEWHDGSYAEEGTGNHALHRRLSSRGKAIFNRVAPYLQHELRQFATTASKRITKEGTDP